ncbi:hypothetical protein SASPL_102686 [Salvia splendens]|uniref:RRM domain-containing protein n=1 Tax=Salvia splendens TaxID=180675 RepID=A0A8X9ADJ1_SALSN|nr:hypothetical protein SASPL_102686 [Salvia splendens]
MVLSPSLKILAIRGRDGYDFDGCRLQVELAHGGRGSSSYDRHSSHNSGSSRGGVSKHSDYLVLFSGLPSSASWQDLKDHMRRAGDVCFSQVYRERDGMRGVVDYNNYDDMKYAIRKLDDSLFRNQFSKAYIRVEEYERRRSYSRSPSKSPYSRSRSISRSPDDRARSGSASPRKKSSHQSLSRSRSSLGLNFDFLHAFVLSSPSGFIVIWPYVAIWGLHVRDLMAYGAQFLATHFFLAIGCKWTARPR